MASAWAKAWGGSWGSAWGQVAEPVPDAVVIGGGGFTYPLDARRSLRHAPKQVAKVITRLAKKQVDECKAEEVALAAAEYERQLVSELAKLDIQYKVLYVEILKEEIERLVLEYRKKMQDEEYEILACLMAMM